MEQLQLREKEIFEMLDEIKGFKFVLIGGYAINTYALPRFSVDCDIVVKDDKETVKIEKKLIKLGYSKEEINEKNISYLGSFKRFGKKIKENFRVSVDILIKGVLDRKAGVVVTADWIFDNSEIKMFRGKTIIEGLKLRIVNLDALFVMKFISCRSTDIRDVFMLAPNIKDKNFVKEEISKKCNFNDNFLRIKEKITSKQFKDGLQGVYGYINDLVFEKHKKAILELEKWNIGLF